MGIENKRHTNAHQPLTSHSPTEASIPPLSARIPLIGKLNPASPTWPNMIDGTGGANPKFILPSVELVYGCCCCHPPPSAL